MPLLCHRCGNSLAADANFCSECAAPLLRYSSPDSGTPNNEAAAPGRRPVTLPEGRSGIQWKSAIRISAIVSLAAGLLSSFLAIGSLIWILGGSVLVIAIYRRKVPSPELQLSLGARIGVLTGALTAIFAVTGNTVLLLVQRYALHQGNALDASLSSTVQQSMSHAATSTEAQAQVSTALSFLLSPEGRAGMVLLGMGFVALIILLLSIAGGVLGVQLYRNRQSAQPII